MSDNDYQLPEGWEWKDGHGGRFDSINRPTAGAQFERELPVGRHPLQLYSLGTPNGQKVTILLEELLALGSEQAHYHAQRIDIVGKYQFRSGFVAVRPNTKIPALLDRSSTPPTRVCECGASLLYFADRYKKFIPHDAAGRTECLN